MAAIKLWKKNRKGILLLGSVIVILLFFISYKWIMPEAETPSTQFKPTTEELTKISTLTDQSGDLSTFFRDLAKTKGAAYAFELLKVAPIKPTTDTHLVGHTIGDVLYEQQGLDGIKVCTDDFRNACSHSIVVGLYKDEGEGALPKIFEACKEAPGGKGAYTMCFHGLGHGIFAASGYSLEKTIEHCKKTGTPEFNNYEYVECSGGAIMELVGGGGHDPEGWKKQRQVYLSTADPIKLCNGPLIDETLKPICYIYITPHLFEAAGVPLGVPPVTKDLAQAFSYCDQIPQDQTRNRRSCYGGFGKELILLAKQRDYKRLDQMQQEEMQTVYEWCAQGGEVRDSESCLVYAMQSLYWGGENDFHAALTFCDGIRQEKSRTICFSEFFGAASYYAADQVHKAQICAEVPKDVESQCKQILRVS